MQQLIEILLEDQFTAVLVTHDISEAVICWLTALFCWMLGKIDLDVNIDLPRPRQRDNAKLIELKEEVLRRVLTTPDAADAFSDPA